MTAKSLTINIATRGRPRLLIETVAATLPNITEAATRLIISVDADDRETFSALASQDFGRNVYVSVAPREDSVGQKWNRAIREAPADVYLPAVDYAPYLTSGFDRAILDAASLFPDGIGCIYGPMANASFPSLQAVTHRFAEFVGGVYPTYFPFWFVDHWVDDLARMIGRIAYVDVAVDCGSRRPDKTTGLRDLRFWATFFDAGQALRRSQAEAMLAAMDEPDWRKTMLRGAFPLVEYRSRWVNQLVRDQAEGIEEMRGGAESEPDERYLRIKQRAEALLMAWFDDLSSDPARAAA